MDKRLLDEIKKTKQQTISSRLNPREQHLKNETMIPRGLKNTEKENSEEQKRVRWKVLETGPGSDGV